MSYHTWEKLRVGLWACECGERLSEDLKCSIYSKSYKKSKDGIVEKLSAKSRSSRMTFRVIESD